MIAIVDYRAGNLTSVARALHYLKQSYRITDDPAVLEQASHVIFPGVGAAGEAMAYLRQTGLDRQIRSLVAAGKPMLGICLGTQVIFEHSEENKTRCLGIVPGTVRLFPRNLQQDGLPLKIPHMGWNEVAFTKTHHVFKDIEPGAAFYFVHSYYPAPDDLSWVLGWTDYGQLFCSAIARGNLVAVQFHPEKSGRPGLRILENFCRWGGRDAE
ncbi:MAG: imidazole glycerol phosphate synthase subunit HisH [Pseudomonadota bacterium]